MGLRKLRDEATGSEGGVAVAEIPKTKVLKTSSGYAEVMQRSEDLSYLDQFKAYIPGEPLPEPIIKKNSKGIRYVHKNGEPRFYFRGNEMVKVYRGLGGKKTQLFWTFKGNDKNPEIAKEHQRIRNYLRAKGIPGA